MAESQPKIKALITLDVLMPIDTTDVKTNYYYCNMEKNNKQPILEQGLDYWKNEVEYFENAIDGLKHAIAITSHYLTIARKKLDEHLEKED